MHLLEMIQSAKTDHGNSTLLDTSALTTETDDKLTIASWVRWINASQQYHQGIVLEAAQDYFGSTQTISYVSGTQEYDLAGNELQIRLIERTDTDPDRIIYPITINDRLLREPRYSDWSIFQKPEYSYLWGNMVGIAPKPTETGTDNVSILYIRRLPDLSYGTASAATTTSITLASTPTFGTTAITDDYYNGATVRIVSGTNSGQQAVATDYDAGTRVITVTEWPGGTPSGTIVYDIVCDIPVQHHEAICIYAAIKAKMSDNENTRQLQIHHQKLIERMVAGLTPRTSQSARYVNYLQDPWYDR